MNFLDYNIKYTLNQVLCFALFTFVYLISLSCNSPDTIKKYKSTKTQPSQKVSSEPFYMIPLVKVIEHHKKVATHMDGPKCPLYPTCSHYAHIAVAKHGIPGLLLFIDRLFFREFSSLHKHYIAVPIKYSKNLRYYDPIKDTFPILKQNEPSLLLDDF